MLCRSEVKAAVQLTFNYFRNVLLIWANCHFTVKIHQVSPCKFKVLAWHWEFWFEVSVLIKNVKWKYHALLHWMFKIQVWESEHRQWWVGDKKDNCWQTSLAGILKIWPHKFEFQHGISKFQISWLTWPFGAILWNENEKLNKNSEWFKSFLRLMSENSASLVHLLSTVCELKGFLFLSILKIWLVDVISWKQRPNSKFWAVQSL